MKQFSELGLAEPILRAVSSEGYTTPTPIQAEVIPALLDGKDVIGIAQTGTGKTAAYVLPLLDVIATDTRRADPKTCKVLILVPTRELATQVATSIRTYGRNMRVTLSVVVGGAKPFPQIRALSTGVDIVIATPGRLEDHMRSGAVRLDRTRVAVLDEADQMLDLGFMPAIRRILGKIPTSRQTILLSATMPAQIRSLARDFIPSPVEIAVTSHAKPIELIDQSVRFVNAGAKRDMLVSLLGGAEVERAIVFTRTKHGADKVCKFLENAGLTTTALHGNKSQGQRDRALGSFKAGKVKVLVATDIAARGIDVDGVSHVINYELPNVPEAYVHRIGRTARAGASGIAVAFCDSSERSLLRDIERLIGQKLAVVGEDNLPPEEHKRPAQNRRPGNGQNRRKKWNSNTDFQSNDRPATGAAPRQGEGARHGEHASRPAGNGGRPASNGAPRAPGANAPKSRWARSKRFVNKGRAARSA